MIEQAYIDMDGVLADFMGSALALHDESVEDYPKGLYAIEKHLNITTEEFWRVIDNAGEDFWTGLDVCEGAMELWELVQPLSPIVLTSPSMNPVCVSGKTKWLQRVFGSDFRDYIFCPAQHKHHIASPGALLIDDREQNIEDWQAHGGYGCLWPHLGNNCKISIADMLEDIKQINK